MAKSYSIKSPLHITANIIASGPRGEKGDSPYVGENGNWWVGDEDTGIYASGGGTAADHAHLTGRDKEDQHPIKAVAGLRDEIARIPPPVEAITNLELEELFK